MYKSGKDILVLREYCIVANYIQVLEINFCLCKLEKIDTDGKVCR